MGGEPTAKMNVVEYRLSMHYGLCHGPVDGLEAIYVNEKLAWEGDATDGTFVVSKRDLFGGRKKEGGVEGRVAILGGGDTQLLTSEMATKLGGTPTSVPGFRGVLSVFFMGLEGASRKGFLWATNNPYVKPASFKIRRMPKGLSGGKEQIGNDANPAHMIYECLTNSVWGMNGSPAQIDTAAFLAAADTLFNEGLGLSMMWTGQSTIQSFVQEILDHIEATFFLHPRTGLLSLKLIRADYDPDTLLVIDPSNAVLTNFQRKGWGETVNEINGSWTNPDNEQDESVTVHDLGNIASQGATISSTRNYYGVRNGSLALRLAIRDLNVASFPIASCEVEVDRRAWDLVPGSVVKVTWPEHQVSGLIMRVGALRYGSAGTPRIRVTLVEDVFAMPLNPYVTPPGSGWVDPSAPPSPLEYADLADAGYYALARLLGDTVAEDLIYPQGYVRLLLAQDDLDTYEVEVRAEGLTSGGDLDYLTIGTRNMSGRAVLIAPAAKAASSVLPSFNTYFGKAGPDTGNLVQFGEGDQSEVEIALVESQGVDGPVLRRGVLDTVPREWPAGTPIWFFNPVSTIYDTTARAATQTVNYKFLPRTTQGVLAVEDAPVDAYTLGDRMHRPYRPANVKVNGVLFAPAVVNYRDGVAFSWSNRNRKSETSVILAWADATVTPEAGQTTHLEIVNAASGAVLFSDATLVGTSVTPAIDPALITGALIEYTLSAERDGLSSLQDVTGSFALAGYGLNYGNYYGGV